MAVKKSKSKITKNLYVCDVYNEYLPVNKPAFPKHWSGVLFRKVEISKDTFLDTVEKLKTDGYKEVTC